MSEFAWFATLALWITLPGSLYLLVLSIAACWGRFFSVGASQAWVDEDLKMALVIPAHNESAVITRTLANICPLAKLDGRVTVVVVADNCSDDTAALAEAAGVRVLRRWHESERGKGYALDYAFRQLADFDAYVVVDADSVIADNFFPEIRKAFAQGARALQVSYQVLNGAASVRSGLAEIALAAFNVLRPSGRMALGWSAGILGNGFALRREVLLQVPYWANSLVEDWEYHWRLVQAGVVVRFVPSTEVRGEMPTGARGCASQHARWQGGRLRMLREHIGGLCAQVLAGRWASLALLLDLCLLPLAYHVLLLLLGLASGQIALLVFSWLVLCLHVLLTFSVAHLPKRRVVLLLCVPFYLLFKLGILWQTLGSASRYSAWVRTNRHGG